MAKHPNVTWREPLSIDRFIEAITKSLELNISVEHGGLKYQCDGRASGDGWTTFGNTILMIAYWEYTFYLANIPKYGLKVKGDDVLFCVNQSEQAALLEAVKINFTTTKHEQEYGLGQICKKIDFGDLTQLDFLSNEFFRTNTGAYRMTRIPARVLQSNSWSTKLPRISDQKALLSARQELCYSKGMCLKSWADNLPIWGVLADKMIELGKPGKLTEYNEYADKDRVWHKGRDDTNEYLLHLEDKYGLTLVEVLSAEKLIRAVKGLDGLIEIPAFEKFYKPFIMSSLL